MPFQYLIFMSRICLAAHWKTGSRSLSYDYNISMYRWLSGHLCQRAVLPEFCFPQNVKFCPFKVLVIIFHLRFAVIFFWNTFIYLFIYLYRPILFLAKECPYHRTKYNLIAACSQLNSWISNITFHIAYDNISYFPICMSFYG